jgi:stearoyl-CoA desaturase (delta-9 desaturase)
MRIDWARCVPFLLMHAACLLVVWVGWSRTAVILALGLYLGRMFAVTAFYHRYFSHRAFRTSRALQFVFAVLGNSTVQRGPLWWASHHRHHHQVADRPPDPHSPEQHGFLWSHVGWFMSKPNFPPRLDLVGDLARFPELRFLDRFDILVPVVGGAMVFALGEVLRVFAPGLGTSGAQLLVWSNLSTVVLFHASFTINSLAHTLGRRRYPTRDTSRNSLLLALLTLGEGWHNNHHRYPAATRQGHYWWEIDVTYYALVVLSWIGLVWDLKPVPREVLASADGARLERA